MALISRCDQTIHVNKCTNTTTKTIPESKEYVDDIFSPEFSGKVCG